MYATYVVVEAKCKVGQVSEVLAAWSHRATTCSLSKELQIYILSYWVSFPSGKHACRQSLDSFNAPGGTRVEVAF